MKSPEVIHPRIVVAERQLELDRLLPNLQHDLDMVNIELGLARVADIDEAVDFTGPLLDQLNEAWPYMGHMFLVRGIWHGKNYDLGGIPDSLKMSSIRPETAFNAVPSTGFQVSQKAKGDFFIGPTFNVGTIAYGTPHELVKIEAFKTADLRDVELEYLRDSSDIVLSALGKLAKPALTSYDALYRNSVSDDDKFYKLNYTAQKKLVYGIVNDANAAVTAPFVTVGATIGGVTTAYARALEGYTKLAPNRNRRTFRVKGILLGVTTLEIDVLDNRRISDKQDLIDADAGLCAIIDPETCRVGNYNTHGNIIVPIKNMGSVALYSW